MADGQYWNDPVFQGMSAHDQMAYMTSQDPVVQKMSPQDQLGYLLHIRSAQWNPVGPQSPSSTSIQGPQQPVKPEFASAIPTGNIPVVSQMLQPFGELAANLQNDPKFREQTATSGAQALAASGSAVAAPIAVPELQAMARAHPYITSAVGSLVGSKIGGWPGMLIGHELARGFSAPEPEPFTPAQTLPPPIRGSSLPPTQSQTAPPPLRGTSLPPQQAQAPPPSFRWGGQPEPAAQTGGPGPSSLSNPVGLGAKDLQPLQRASSRITHDAYDPQNQLATFRFPNGQVTEYHGISPQNWADYKNSPSLGQGFEQNIINKASASRPIPRLTGGQKASIALRRP